MNCEPSTQGGTDALPWATLGRPVGASEGWTGYGVGCEVAGVGFPCFWVGDVREVMALCIGFFVVDFS